MEGGSTCYAHPPHHSVHDQWQLFQQERGKEVNDTKPNGKEQHHGDYANEGIAAGIILCLFICPVIALITQSVAITAISAFFIWLVGAKLAQEYFKRRFPRR